MNKFKGFCGMLGLHPLVGFFMIVLDLMLFGAEAATAFLSTPVTVAIGLVSSIPCALVQKYCFDKNWGAAIGKGLIVGILTAIPTPLPSVVTGLLTGAGIVKKLLPDSSESETKEE